MMNEGFSVMLLRFCGNVSRIAKASCDFAAMFRTSRKLPAVLRQRFAHRESFLRFCGNVSHVAKASCSFAATFRTSRKLPAVLQERDFALILPTAFSMLHSNKQFRFLACAEILVKIRGKRIGERARPFRTLFHAGATLDAPLRVAVDFTVDHRNSLHRADGDAVLALRAEVEVGKRRGRLCRFFLLIREMPLHRERLHFLPTLQRMYLFQDMLAEKERHVVIRLVRTTRCYRVFRRAKRMLPDERPRRHRGKTLATKHVREFQQRIVVVSIAIHDNRYHWRLLSPEHLQPFERDIRHATAIHGDRHERQFALDAFHAGRFLVSQIRFRIRNSAHPFRDGMHDSGRRVGGRKINDMYIRTIHFILLTLCR